METRASVMSCFGSSSLLIAPQWDGNKYVLLELRGRGLLLIAPQWDGNRIASRSPPVTPQAFNRTTVGWKHGSVDIGTADLM